MQNPPQFNDQMGVRDIIRVQYSEYSTCDFRDLATPFCYLSFIVYLFLLIRYWRRTGRRCATEIGQGEEEFAEMYEQALWKHVQRSTLYLRLFDLLVVADPSQQGERLAIRQRFRTSLKEIPPELCLEALRDPSEEKGFRKKADWLESVDQWADTCWESIVLEAQQQLTPEQWADPYRFEHVCGDQVRESDLHSKKIYNVEFRMCYAPDLYSDMAYNFDLLQACGVTLTRAEIDHAMSEDHIWSDFTPILLKRVYDAGHTVISLKRLDYFFLFVRLRDVPAVESILRALHPQLPTNSDQLKSGHIYGEMRILNAGESFETPGKKLEDEVEHAQAAMQHHREHPPVPVDPEPRRSLPLVCLCGCAIYIAQLGCCFIFLATILFVLATAVGFSLNYAAQGIQWICKNYIVSWLTATVMDCVAPALSYIIAYSFAWLLLNCVTVIPLIDWLHREPLAAQRNNRRRGRPASVLLPNQLLQL